MHSFSFNISNPVYPQKLKQIYNPPRQLFYRGNLDVLSKTAISIVGTRQFSEYGEEITNQIVSDFRGLDVVIVSGLAKGIDSIAHRAALANDLPTIAVLGSGINNVYPPENLALASEIEKSGLILSEYPDTTPPASFHFPQRNRIVSGLSIATVVVEAKEKSGAFITAKLALEQGREVFTVPGDFYRETSRGPLKLLQEGVAYPISSGRDILEVLKMQPAFDFTQSKPYENLFQLSPDETAILSALHKLSGSTFSTLSKKVPLPMPRILATLSMLEIKDLIKFHDGKYFRKC
ncbi:MAG: DNA-processing protein DprA [Candidatus Gracilibacteria bacterium]